MKHFLGISDFPKNEIEIILQDASLIEKYWNRSKSYCDQFVLENKCITTFFTEPSTRTRFSFERAAHWLGIHVLTSADASHSSSLTKEESIKDTLTTIGQYCNAIVMRHKDESFVDIARKYSPVPVINAGSGSAEHPTQALLDLYTIKKKFNDLNGLPVLICGDLLHGRTVHSLVKLLDLYGCKVTLCPASMKTFLPWMSEKPIIKNFDIPFDYLKDCKINIVNPEDVNDVLPEMEVIYMTRIQKERFSEKGSNFNFFRLDESNIDKVKQTAIILHPLPRNSEISEAIDVDPRATYHQKQVRNGIYIRASLLNHILRVSNS